MMNNKIEMGLGFIAGILTGSLLINHINKKNDCEEKLEKYRGYYDVLNKWLNLKENGLSIEQYFEEKGYHSIAIYGMGELGKHLYSELRDTNIDVKYAIDKHPVSAEIRTFDLDSNLDEVDIVVITTPFVYEEVKEVLERKMNCEIISISELLYEFE